MISLDGVAVPQVEGKYLDFRPYDHQAQAEELIATRTHFFAINTSPTGSGKTFSWLKPALENRIDTIAAFPTNALVADQVEAAEKLVSSRYPDANVIEATGETIAKWRDEEGTTKGKALRRVLDQSLFRNPVTVVMTNPDIFTIVRKELYHHRDVSNQFDRFEMLVFDEFHIADIRQRDLLLFLVDEINEMPDTLSRLNKFFFLSATPEDSSTHRNLETRILEDLREDPSTIRADSRPLSEVPQENWRGVMPPVNLELKESQTFRAAEKLLEEDAFEEFLEFCRRGQTVVILDGVHEVDEVYRRLSSEFDGEVHRITGFNDEEARRKIKSFDVLVSNSAVEVGLDFQPERLVFSAANASSLIQRLGRLRERADREEPYEAWCYVPGPVKAKVESELNGKSSTRHMFERCVKEAFDDEIDLSSFSWRWSDIEAYDHVLQRIDDVPSDVKEEVRREGLYRIQRHYYNPYGRAFEKDDLKRLHDWTSKGLVEEMKTYRGTGLQVMVRDRVAGEMKLYGVLHLLSWGLVKFFPETEFRRRLTKNEREFYDAYSQYAVGFCEFNGKIESDRDEGYAGRSVSFTPENEAFYAMIHAKDRERRPEILSGLNIRVEMNDTPPIQGLGYLKDQISDAERLVYAFPGKPSMNKAVYGFGDFFFVYPFDGNSLTIGTTALYAHCLVQDRVEREAKERQWEWD